MAHRAKQIVRATLRAYDNAIADGANEDAAYEAACAVYSYGHPLVSQAVIRHIVAVLVGRPPPGRRLAAERGHKREPSGAARARPKRDVAAAHRAYVDAIARGAKAPAAFEAAKIAFRARHPELSGARLDDAVARALATDADE